MKFFGEQIPQSSNNRKIKGYIEGSEEQGYGDDIKYFQINKMVPTRFGAQEFLQKINLSGGVWSIKMLPR